MNTETLEPKQLELLKDRVTRSAVQLKNEMLGIAVFGTIICVIGGLYTISMVIRPLKKLVQFAEENGKTELPEIKSNTELKQLATAIEVLTGKLKQEEKKK
jgi:nitrate/nitrite-specific signal transduction histidine kinase